MPHAAPGRALIARAFLAVALSASLPVAAELYKWVDEKGVTHYSEQPPPDRKATKLQLPSTPPAPSGGTAESWKQKEIEMRKQRIEKEQAEEKDKAASDQSTAGRRQACLRARRQLDVLNAGRPIYHVNEQGQRIFMDDAEREAETKKWSKEAEEACG